ncbi:hypothetical protein MNBD_UNCLBAC01-818 [hydrothermal vent metagenome]|uniref:Uncharacterized protein n=1 Tax=hydrothermal vent metagenome TaxID=652676 RepID=A0A3B1DKC4_9ZZZZ
MPNSFRYYLPYGFLFFGVVFIIIDIFEMVHSPFKEYSSIVSKFFLGTAFILTYYNYPKFYKNPQYKIYLLMSYGFISLGVLSIIFYPGSPRINFLVILILLILFIKNEVKIKRRSKR